MGKTLWILTEERPKPEVIMKIASIFAKDKGIGAICDPIRFLPILDDNGNFTFTYEVRGLIFSKSIVSKVILKIISGSSSFVDHLVYWQDTVPSSNNEPLYAIEETKTDDSESRNTGAFQRITKFIYVSHYYPNTIKVMLYNLKVQQKEEATASNNFGNRLLLTLGVRLAGKKFDKDLKPFHSIDELIKVRNSVRKPPRGNVAVQIKKYGEKIEVSGRLVKGSSLSHDPNIGLLTGICSCLRKLGYKKEIVLTEHGLEQAMLKPNNKFMRIAEYYNLSLENLNRPLNIIWPKYYWRYEKTSEKIGSIFIHLSIKSFTHGYSLFENHAGCEKGYFLRPDGSVEPIAKYKDREKYKNGDKSQIIHFPDLVILDNRNYEVINIEGKQTKNTLQGIADLDNFDAFEEFYIQKYYQEFCIVRTLVLYGGSETKITEEKVGFLLNKNGTIVLSNYSPKIFILAIKNIKEFYGIN